MVDNLTRTQFLFLSCAGPNDGFDNLLLRKISGWQVADLGGGVFGNCPLSTHPVNGIR